MSHLLFIRLGMTIGCKAQRSSHEDTEMGDCKSVCEIALAIDVQRFKNMVKGGQKKR